jgi:leucyl aminopeptidase
MHNANAPLLLVPTPASQVDTDLMAIPIFEEDDLADVAGLDGASGGEVARALHTREITGKPFEVLVTPVIHHWKARRLMLVGAGRKDRFCADVARRVAATAALGARQRKASRLALVHRVAGEGASADRHPVRLLQAQAEGLVLSQYDGPRYKNAPLELTHLSDVRIVAWELGASVRAEAAGAVERGRILGESTNVSRALANEPSNELTPSTLAQRAADIASSAGLAVEVLDEEAIAALGMGLLLGVARGSAAPPRLIVLRHDPPGAPATPVLGLVGKGITFDTGGISIKPADGMERMKVDMSGGAAVIGAMRALALLKTPVRVIGVVPAAENMPGGRAIKPGDILRSASGKTVEVINTDAEGRLILGDGLWYARELGATHLIDIATLTGACVVALGRLASGLFGRPDGFVELVRERSDLAGDRMWPMPVLDDYFDQLKSDLADMTNTGGRPAGAITAAVFLKQFAGELPWAHLDVAGTAWLDEPKPWMVRGATGVAVRALAEVALALSAPRA